MFQTSVMHLVLATDESFWKPAKKKFCFLVSLENLLQGFQQDFICDVFFPKVFIGRIAMFVSSS